MGSKVPAGQKERICHWQPVGQQLKMHGGPSRHVCGDSKPGTCTPTILMPRAPRTPRTYAPLSVRVTESVFLDLRQALSLVVENQLCFCTSEL